VVGAFERNNGLNYIKEVKMKKFGKVQSVAVAAFMAIAITVPAAFGQTTDEGGRGKDRRGHFGHRGGRGGFMSFRNLDLTDAQKAQMKQIHEASRASVAPIMEQIRAKRQEIRQANEGGTFNEAAVAQKLTEIAPLEAKLQAERFRVHQQMLSILTPEQKAKLEQSREQFKQRWAERRANKQQKNR
jgi:periplasmic protein CpxP/Spy